MGRLSKFKKMQQLLQEKVMISPMGEKYFVIGPNVIAASYAQISRNGDNGDFTLLWVGPITKKVKVIATDFGCLSIALQTADRLKSEYDQRQREKNLQNSLTNEKVF